MPHDPKQRHIVLTGAGRGLGLEFTRQWLEAGHRVFALARHPDASPDLAELAERHPGALFLQRCDVADDASVEAARDAVAKAWDAVDILLNNAGVGDRYSAKLGDIDFARLRDVYEVNALGPLRLIRAFLPMLRHGSQPRVVNVTSLMGSISDNHSGGSYGYRMSKAALNMATRSLGHELGPEGIVSIVIHPGWVRTDMGGSRAPVEPKDAIAAMIRTIDALGPEHAGTFVDRDGKPLPW